MKGHEWERWARVLVAVGALCVTAPVASGALGSLMRDGAPWWVAMPLLGGALVAMVWADRWRVEKRPGFPKERAIGRSLMLGAIVVASATTAVSAPRWDAQSIVSASAFVLGYAAVYVAAEVAFRDVRREHDPAGSSP